MATSVLQLFPSLNPPGDRLIDAQDVARMADLTFGVQSGVIAKAGGGQSLATVIKSVLASIDTVGTAADSIQLPPAIPGLQLNICNNTLTSMQVFGNPSNGNNNNAGDTIAASGSNAQVATATGVAHAAATVFTYICFIAGQWRQT